MNNFLKIMGVAVVGVGGYWLGGGFTMEESPLVSINQKEPIYWVAPMDKNYRRDKPGKSLMGMDLIAVYESDGNKGDVRISPAVENNLGVRTAQVSSQAMMQTIHTVGFVQFDEELLTHIHPRVEGWIEKLGVYSVGDRVEKDDLLFELYAPQLVSAQDEYLAAKNTNNQALKKASRRRLAALGFAEQQILRLDKENKVSQRVPFYAPRSGVLSSLNVRQGMFVKPQLEVMAIGQLQGIWVVAEIFERQAGWLSVGQAVSLKTESYPGEIWIGVTEYIYPVLDEETRTTQVRIRFDNTDLRLKPNMYVDLKIKVGDDSTRLSVPSEAVIRGASMDRVVMSTGSGRYRSVWVKTGIENDHRTEILEGLTSEDTVVVSGQFLIDSESNIDAEMLRMESPVNGHGE